MLLGKILAEAAMLQNKKTTWLPAYGAEVRGGTAYCAVVISDGDISSPIVASADTLIAMNEPSLVKFRGRVAPRGLLLANASLLTTAAQKISGCRYFAFTDLAIQLGNIRVANMVALGTYLAIKKVLSLETIMKVIKKIAPADKKHLVAINQEAVKKGVGLVR